MPNLTAFIHIAVFVFLSLSLSTFPRNASGQPHADRETWFEVSEISGWLGPSATWFGGVDASNEAFTSSRRAGFAAAVQVIYPLHNWLSAVSGLGFSTKGAKYEFRTGRSSEFRSGYVLVPLLVQLTPYRLGRFEPYLLAGAELGLMTSCKLSDESSVGDCKDTSNLLDPGLVVGGGMAIALPWPGRVRLEVRYEYGLISIDDMEITQIDSDYKNRALLFSIGYSHRLGETEPR